MPVDETRSVPQGEPPSELSPAAEAKRRDARRKFLARSTAGAGFVIVTLHHERGVAGYTGGGYDSKILVSSAEACESIGKKKTGTKEAYTSFSPKNKVTRIVCE